MTKILLTGGTGLLGKELQKLRKFEWAPSKSEFDICDTQSMWDYLIDNGAQTVDLIVNCAAYTKVELAEVYKDECYEANVKGTREMASFLKGIPIIHISTAYVFDGEKGNYKESDTVNPLNYYSLTKALAEEVILAGDRRNCVIRTLFKPRPWPFWAAYTDQITSGGYVDEIAAKINQAIDLYTALPSILHIGMKRQSIFELASESKKVAGMSRADVNAKLPKDVSLDDTLWKIITGEE